ncbi:helix-loop-helix DNA-binding domain-containing protein [Colletotrichum scovillei]|uniref:Helix-loop-helix DNA-binding domain-containing protein n=4 Tax=Colletotrichum acutatum species complex TaxID=2707335 RepID=A0A9P7R0K5_9PEZI|nr:helix-loop-helix DNA-binding domain-containing protein [Colletotrichum scovillei]XP_060310465.1 helix-loop-helix DNA-binding domain-containing protein [Colletotrichum costaricense]XP_060382090.1 helix-loop-helix DNA-binding domain-containing protein [Colletotrichum tamarilloi]XP_060403686.1 helix-loop-helix DNA-binding domain-containing protein [Colletotrichum abscissum]KAI3529292.1 helix-loop-helix DNA-binding domain-containing protein [Colletotrichum filicis]KAF4776247.1 helix-loop-helix 
MADQDPNALFGLDDSNLGVPPSFLDDSDGQNVKSDRTGSSIANDNQVYYDANNWSFQDTPPYDTYNIAAVTTAAGATPLFQTAAPWDFSPNNQHHQHGPPAVTSGLDHSTLAQAGFYAAPPPAPNNQQSHRGGQPHTLPQETLSTLTPAQQEKLRNIAMPAHLQYQSPKSEPSPGSATSDHKAAGLSSPDAHDSSKASRKRKSSADVDDDEEEDEDGQPIKKTAHNMIEKRYRTNLNDKIAALRDSVPSLRIMSKSARGEDTTEDREELHGLTPAHKLNKATVLSKATEYIRHLEKRNNRLCDENHAMQNRIAAFEKLFMAGAMNGAMSPLQQPPTPMQYPQDQYMSTPIGTPRGESAQGMIPVPDDMKRIISAQMAAGQPYPMPQQNYRGNPNVMRQQQIQQQQQQQQMQQQGRWGNSSQYFGKLMVGSLAGLMIVEAVRENEQSNDTPEGRGLFALPIQLLSYLGSTSHMHIGGYYISPAQIISHLKLLFFLGTCLWVFVPSLFVPSEGKPKKAQRLRESLQAAGSVASPIHVRRQAWLTAIQTVWVPQHNFFLEAAALIMKTMKLSMRNAIGVHGYQMLTGLTEEQEAARVKAWSIALDAQLAGGDVEINKSRLTLTLLASGTLPDTPSRLMLKALHVRVLLWDLGAKGLHNIVAKKVARSLWNEARNQNRVLSQLRRNSEQVDDDLPEHLAALIEQECDDVLNNSVVQRAYNLAWNLSTTEGVTEHNDGMDTVVDDQAVRSPLDAVAAWWSSQTIQRALITSLEASKDDGDAPRVVSTCLTTALKTSPIGSGVQARALVARAVLVDEKRGANIAAALQNIKPTSEQKSLSKIAAIIDSSSTAQSPDVQMALDCAMAIAHLQRAKLAATPSQKGFGIIEKIARPSATANMSLLGCTALFKLMEELYAQQSSSDNFSTSLERVAGSLRIWIGSAPGEKCGLEQDVRHKMVDRCLSITKSVVGMETDTGYGSMSECEEDGC